MGVAQLFLGASIAQHVQIIKKRLGNSNHSILILPINTINVIFN